MPYGVAYSAKVRQKAEQLRSSGHSYAQISKRLGVASATLSHWKLPKYAGVAQKRQKANNHRARMAQKAQILRARGMTFKEIAFIFKTNKHEVARWPIDRAFTMACRVCGEDFQVSNTTDKLCSRNCRRKAKHLFTRRWEKTEKGKEERRRNAQRLNEKQRAIAAAQPPRGCKNCGKEIERGSSRRYCPPCKERETRAAVERMHFGLWFNYHRNIEESRAKGREEAAKKYKDNPAKYRKKRRLIRRSDIERYRTEAWAFQIRKKYDFEPSPEMWALLAGRRQLYRELGVTPSLGIIFVADE